MAKEIDKLNPKKAAGNDEIPTTVLKELSRKGMVMITYIVNASLQLEHVPLSFKTAKFVMIPKPGKPKEETVSYRSISLLTALSKLFEKFVLKRIQPLIVLPNHQFGFREAHATVDPVQRVTTVRESV